MSRDVVFRKPVVFRPAPDIVLYNSGSASYITAGLAAAAIAFGGTAIGSTTATDGGTASGEITFAPTTITTINLEVSASNAVTFGGSATGREFSSRTAAASVVFGGTASGTPFAVGSIVFAGTATPASGYFTAEVSGPIAWGGTAAGTISDQASAAIVFGGTVQDFRTAAASVVFGGTAAAAEIFESEASGEIALAGTAVGGLTDSATSEITFAGSLGEPEITGGTLEATATAGIVFAGTATPANPTATATGALIFAGSAAGYSQLPSIPYLIDSQDVSYTVVIRGTT